MKFWNDFDRSRFRKKERAIAEDAFWIAAERYENSKHTTEDLWAAWDLVLDYTDDAYVRLATKYALSKQYYGFRMISESPWFFVESQQGGCNQTRKQLFTEARKTWHKSWFGKDLEKLNEKRLGMPAYAQSGFGY